MRIPIHLSELPQITSNNRTVHFSGLSLVSILHVSCNVQTWRTYSNNTHVHLMIVIMPVYNMYSQNIGRSWWHFPVLDESWLCSPLLISVQKGTTSSVSWSNYSSVRHAEPRKRYQRDEWQSSQTKLTPLPCTCFHTDNYLQADQIGWTPSFRLKKNHRMVYSLY